MKPKINKYDFFVIACIAIVAITVLFAMKVGANSGGYAVVTINGEHYGEYSLDIDGRFVIGDKNHHSTLVIENGSAKIEDATCPDKLCQKQGTIRFDKQILACLPNATVITVVSDKAPQNDFIQ